MQDFFMSPKVDYMFKRIFGDIKNTDLLLDFLNALFEACGQSRICELEILNPFIDKEMLSDKLTVLDIRARTELGKFIIVEIQLKKHRNFIQRTLYYWSKLFSGQLTEGMDYESLQSVIMINILDFKLLPHPEVYSLFEINGRTLHHQLTDMMEMYVLELPKLMRLDILSQTTLNQMDKLSKWLYFISSETKKHWEVLSMDEPMIEKAMKEADYLNQDPMARQQYVYRVMAIADAKARESYVQELAMEEGFVKGMEQGIEQGMEQGREQGELAKARQIAIKMLETGIEPEQVAHLTDMTLDDVKELANSEKD